MSVFAEIRKRAAARKGGEVILEKLLGERPNNQNLEKLTDDRILAAMAERIFSAGFVWKVIRDKWPGFEEAFMGFEPKALIFQPDDFWDGLASDERIVRHAAKIRSIRDNAVFVDRISTERGSFGKLLAEWRADDQLGLLEYLSKHGSRLGGNTGQYFLRWIGWDSYILSKDAIAALQQAGLEIPDNITSKRDRAKIQNQMNEWAQETSLPYAHLSKILAFSTGVNHDPEEIIRRTGSGQ